MKIGIDLDDVITDTAQGIADTLNERYGYNLTIDHFTCYHIENCTEVTEEHMRSVVMDPGFYVDLALKPGALETLQAMRAAKHEIYLDTARPKEVWSVTLNYLRAKRIPYSVLIFEPDKRAAVIKHGLSAFLDDRHATVNAIGLTLRSLGLLPDRPWNGGPLANEVDTIERARAILKAGSNGTMRLDRYNYWAQMAEIIGFSL